MPFFNPTYQQRIEAHATSFQKVQAIFLGKCLAAAVKPVTKTTIAPPQNEHIDL